MTKPEMMSGMYEHAQKLMADLASGNTTGVMQEIETLREPHDGGWHARYVLHTPCEIIGFAA